MSEKIAGNTDAFFSDVAGLLHAARSKAYRAVNSIMVETYWNIGRHIVEQEQQGKGRAGYGDALIAGLSRHLTDTFGKGFSEANIKNMRQFYVVFPDFRQFATHCVANLSWTNIRSIMRLENEAERNDYLREASSENWSSRVLERNIKSGYYRRLLSSRERPEAPTLPATPVPADFIKDPYVLEFLDLPEDVSGRESLLAGVARATTPRSASSSARTRPKRW